MQTNSLQQFRNFRMPYLFELRKIEAIAQKYADEMGVPTEIWQRTLDVHNSNSISMFITTGKPEKEKNELWFFVLDLYPSKYTKRRVVNE